MNTEKDPKIEAAISALETLGEDPKPEVELTAEESELQPIKAVHKGQLKAFQIPGLFLEIEEALSMLPPDAPCPADIRAKVDILCKDGPTAMNNMVLAIRNLEGEAETIGKMISQLAYRKQSKENAVARFRMLGLDICDGLFNGKIKTELFTIYGQNYPSSSLAFDSEDEAEQLTILKGLDPRFVKVETTLRVSVLKDAVKAGEAIPAGLHEVKKSSRSLQIR